MNWGKSIVLSFIIFISFVSVLVYKMATAKVDLVQADYYQKEIDYQQQIERLENSKNLETPTSILYLADNQIIRINFPTTVVNGEITFFRSSDKELDIKLPLAKQPLFEYSTQKLQKGTWKVQVVWNDGAREYFAEKEITI